METENKGLPTSDINMGLSPSLCPRFQTKELGRWMHKLLTGVESGSLNYLPLPLSEERGGGGSFFSGMVSTTAPNSCGPAETLQFRLILLTQNKF